jgi:SWI/SNF-related matrix-associated actin-dependent regulator of chromatin subfamily A3
MNDSKRSWDTAYGPTSTDWPPLKRHATSGRELSSNGDLELSWAEVWPSILCREGIPPVGCDDNSRLLEEHLSGTGSASNAEKEVSEEFTTIADVSHRIQVWAEATVPLSVAEDADATNMEQNGTRSAQCQTGKSIKCFGMIHASAARLIGNMPLLRSELMAITPKDMAFPLRLAFTTQFISLLSEHGTQIGQLKDSLTDPLNRISDIPSLRLEAFASIKDTLRCIDRAKRQHDSVIKVDINVYGSTNVRDEVGRSLSADRLYLQHTKHRKDEFDYDNPHMLVFDDIDLESALPHIDHELLQTVEPSKIQETIMDVCQAETRDRGLRGLEHDIRVTTPLLLHQEQALEYMVQREIGPIPDGFQLWRHVSEQGRSGFRHAITGHLALTPLPEMGGGILADDMGMGKSLSTLSLVTQRLSDGWDWSQSRSSEGMSGDTHMVRSRATLIIVSSLLIMNTWFTEIGNHLDGSLKVVKYHGKRRESRIENVANSDIVVTTYHTLAAERKSKRSPLKAINWFRIVLDEAHTIRRQATTLFAAVRELSSCHRWCLTGTPIQNTLDDLGSLLAFIRAEPFERVSMFRRYVIAPFSEDLGEATKNLALLLDSICLRRRIERLHLPPLDEHVHHVDLSSNERSHYETTLNSMAYAVSHRSSQQYAKFPFGKFQIQLQLRILCNHGTFQRPFEWGQDDAQTRREEAMNSIGKDGEIRCARCHERTLILETNCAASRQSQTCAHVFCDECVSQMAEEPSAPTQIFSCPYCAAHSDRIRPSAQGRQSVLFNRPASLMFDDSGYSAKMEKLMGHVVDRLSSTKRWVNSTSLCLQELAYKGDRLVLFSLLGNGHWTWLLCILIDFKLFLRVSMAIPHSARDKQFWTILRLISILGPY